MFFLRFAQAHLLYVLLPLYFIVLLYRWKFYKSPRYTYPLTGDLAQQGFVNRARLPRFLLRLLRSGALLLLAFLAAQPQWVDERSVINVDGVDIVIALDVSGSMSYFDDPSEQRTRIDIAKQEAIRFIEKRANDPIGLVIFAHDALSRCPLTLDKKMLKERVGELEIGSLINEDGTALGTGLASAVNRLKNSKAKSKVIILLTDGESTPHCEKIDPVRAADLAKQFGVKVYTVGIGNEHGAFMMHPFFGPQPVAGTFNVRLLEKIAADTGGVFFRASSPQDMRAIYDKIDRLERTEYQTNMFQNYYEAFLSVIWIVFLLLGLELALRLFVWRGI